MLCGKNQNFSTPTRNQIPTVQFITSHFTGRGWDMEVVPRWNVFLFQNTHFTRKRDKLQFRSTVFQTIYVNNTKQIKAFLPSLRYTAAFLPSPTNFFDSENAAFLKNLSEMTSSRNYKNWHTMAHILANEAFLLQYKYSSQTSGNLAFHLPTQCDNQPEVFYVKVVQV